jgi:hypothetical protein
MYRLLAIQLFCLVHFNVLAQQPSAAKEETEEPSEVIDCGVYEAPRGTTVVVTDKNKTEEKSPARPPSVVAINRSAEAESMDDAKRPDNDADGPPRARVGNVQIINRLGVQFPFGSFRKGTNASYINGIGFRSLLEIGYKLTPHWFLGGYLDETIGAPGEVLEKECETEDYTCISRSAGIGLDLQYHFFPAERWNPWVAYLIGISYTSTNTGFFGGDITVGAVSFDFLHLSGGVDLRLGRVFGIGLYTEYATGFFFTEIRIEDREAESSDIDEVVLHHNVGFGLRLVFLP